MRRRMFLALAATGLATGTAGCSGIGGDGDDGTDATDGTGRTGRSDTTTSARTTDAAETTTTATPTAPTTMTGETTTGTTTTTGRRTATVVGTTDGNSSSTNSSSGGGDSGVSGRVTSVPDGLEVTERQFYSGQFSTGVRGILENVSRNPFEYVEIRATFYDAQGTRLDTGIDYDSGLAPGAEWPFDVVYRGSADPSQIARYTLMVDTSPF